MEVEIFTLADYATDAGTGKLYISGTFDTLFAHEFPVIHPMACVVVRFRIANKDAGKHSLKIRAIDPDGRDLHPPLVGEVDSKMNKNADYTSFNVIWNLLNTKLVKPGVYALEFIYDGDVKTGMKLNVVKANPQPNALRQV